MLRFIVFFLRIICWSSSFMCELCWANTQLILSILGKGGGWGGLFPEKYLSENYERTWQGNLLESSVHFVAEILILQFQQKL